MNENLMDHINKRKADRQRELYAAQNALETSIQNAEFSNASYYSSLCAVIRGAIQELEALTVILALG